VNPPEFLSLSSLAKLAFPVTKQERAESQVHVVTRQREAAGGWGHGVKRALAEKAAKKSAKKAAKKAPAKKLPKRP